MTPGGRRYKNKVLFLLGDNRTRKLVVYELKEDTQSGTLISSFFSSVLLDERTSMRGHPFLCVCSLYAFITVHHKVVRLISCLP